MKKKYLYYKIGCFVLAGTMLTAAVPQTYTFAAQDAPVAAETQKEAVQTEMGADDTEQTETIQTEPETKTEQAAEALPKDENEEAKKETEVLEESEIPTLESKESEVSREESLPQISERPNDKVIDFSGTTEEETIQKPEDAVSQSDHSDAAANLTVNIIAGNGVYLSELSTEYGLVFDDNFEKTMDKIEKDYRAFLKKPNAFRAENWQDVLAVYVMKYASQENVITMDKSCREELEQIFFLMNVRSDSAILRKLEKVQESNLEEADLISDTETKKKEYYPLTVEDYIALYDADETQQKILRKYTSAKCRQLCAIITSSEGFVRSEIGADMSEKRVRVVAAACSLIGKVGYFWGGKSYAVGWDDRWGTPMTVSAAGSRSSGTVRSYGLDCSGFVAWAYYNGLNGKDIGIGNHTTAQWNATEMVDAQDAEPGDLVFYRPGSAGDDNHVGIVVGVNENGSLLVAHCSSSQNGVVVGEAWSSGFQYVRTSLDLD